MLYICTATIIITALLLYYNCIIKNYKHANKIRPSKIYGDSVIVNNKNKWLIEIQKILKCFSTLFVIAAMNDRKLHNVLWQINHDVAMWGNSTLFHLAKSIEKHIEKK